MFSRPSDAALRPQIVAFAESMEREMQANAHKDGHPMSHDFSYLALELRVHVDKFVKFPTAEHAADVANLAMLALAEAPVVTAALSPEATL